MKYNKKIKLLTKKEQQLQFDLQSKMCNWLYNQLFQLVEQDYVNGNAKKFLFGRNLRNQVPTFKQQHPFLYKVHSSPLKNVALRLKDAYDRWLNPELDNEKVGIDNEGRTYELQRITSVLQYWDKKIDQVKSKRDQCQRQSRFVITPHTEYWKPSPRWERLNRVVEKAYLKRREQIKLILYRYAHYFSRKYDTIIIGDYTPTVDVAEHDTMHRAMLNQTSIGQFRTILKWV